MPLLLLLLPMQPLLLILLATSSAKTEGEVYVTPSGRFEIHSRPLTRSESSYTIAMEIATQVDLSDAEWNAFSKAFEKVQSPEHLTTMKIRFLRDSLPDRAQRYLKINDSFLEKLKLTGPSRCCRTLQKLFDRFRFLKMVEARRRQNAEQADKDNSQLDHDPEPRGHHLSANGLLTATSAADSSVVANEVERVQGCDFVSGKVIAFSDPKVSTQPRAEQEPRRIHRIRPDNVVRQDPVKTSLEVPRLKKKEATLGMGTLHRVVVVCESFCDVHCHRCHNGFACSMAAVHTAGFTCVAAVAVQRLHYCLCS